MENINEMEEQINKLSLDFFAINKDDKTLLRKREVLRSQLWISLLEYYKIKYYKKINNEFIYDTVIDTINYSLENFKIEKGTPFLHYINKAVKQEITRSVEKNNFNFIHIPNYIKSLAKKLKIIATQKGIDTNDYSEMLNLGLQLGQTKETLEAVIDFSMGKFYLKETIICNKEEENKEFDVLDNIESDLFIPHNMIKEDEELSNYEEKMQLIDEAFLERQDRIKPYLSALLTYKFYNAIKVLEIKLNKKFNFKFIDANLMKEIMKYEQKNNKLPTQEMIAEKFGRDKTDASRTFNKFKKEIMDKLENKNY